VVLLYDSIAHAGRELMPAGPLGVGSMAVSDAVV